MSLSFDRNLHRAQLALAGKDASAAPVAGTVQPSPILLLRRGPVAMRSMVALHDDLRLELFVTHELTPEWISFAQRLAGVLVATEGDPADALTYAITAGMPSPIVMLMTKAYKPAWKDLIAAGASACIMLPVTARALTRVMPILAPHTASAQMDCTLRLLMDPIGRTVRYHDKSVRLSQREFAVLHCLSSHGGRPVSAEDLLTSVWGDVLSEDRTRQILDVYIFQLRKRLERLGLAGAISTVRGFGYALVDVDDDEPTPVTHSIRRAR